MDLDNPWLISLIGEWHGKYVKDIPDHQAGLCIGAYDQNKKLGSRSTQSGLWVQMIDFKVVSKHNKEAKKWGCKRNKAETHENSEQLVKSRKVIQMYDEFPPLKSWILKEFFMLLCLS